MPRQSDLSFTFTPKGSETRFEVIEFKLSEGLSRPFRLDLSLSSDDANVDFSGLLDQFALFTLWQGSTAARHVHGIISSVTVGQSGFRRTHYQVVMEPQLSRLGLCSNWRIFQGLSVPQIIDKVLGEHHVFNREQLIADPHPSREYCVQAGETDLDFVARLAAEEGLLYTFFHDEHGHRLICTDRVSSLGQIGVEGSCSVLYQGSAGGDQPCPALTEFHYTEQVGTARQVQRDYTFTHPRYNLQHACESHDLQRQSSRYERFDYPGGYKRDAAGKPFTQTRLLALRNQTRVAQVLGDDSRLQPGREFQLVEHPREGFNTWWRPVSIVHSGKQLVSQEEDACGSTTGTTYTQSAQLVEGHADWKASPLPKPQIHGTQTATVTGPVGEEIYCDEWGRVKISFPWDRESNHDDKSSCWVRVTQGWAGTGWGAMAVPRIGQEMIVAFHDGDPDQPIILGRAYRAGNMPPYELPRHKTRMTIKSQTHKGDGFNELRFEDELGQQEVFIHAQKDQNNVVRHDETTDVGHDRKEAVGNDEQIRIGNDQSVIVGKNCTYNIGGIHNVNIGTDLSEKVGNHRYDAVTADYRLEVGGNSTQQVNGRQTLTVGQGIGVQTTDYVLAASERLVIRGPGGSIVLDATGIHIDATTLNITGPVHRTDGGSGQVLGLHLAPETGQQCESRGK